MPPTLTLPATLTQRSRDRQGDLLEPTGLDFTPYLQNPVVLWAHDLTRPPIGRVLRIERNTHTVIADIEFADTPLAREIHALYRDGFLHAWSLGFIPRLRRPLPAHAPLPDPPASADIPSTEWFAAARHERPIPASGNQSDAPTADRLRLVKSWPAPPPHDRRNERPDGFHILAAEVVEISAVPVPAHPEALTRDVTPPGRPSRFRHRSSNRYLQTRAFIHDATCEDERANHPPVPPSPTRLRADDAGGLLRELLDRMATASAAAAASWPRARPQAMAR